MSLSTPRHRPIVVMSSAPDVLLAGLSVPGASPFRAMLPAILLAGAGPRSFLVPVVRDASGVGSTITEHG
jgi:hypothetical protein